MFSSAESRNRDGRLAVRERVIGFGGGSRDGGGVVATLRPAAPKPAIPSRTGATRPGPAGDRKPSLDSAEPTPARARERAECWLSRVREAQRRVENRRCPRPPREHQQARRRPRHEPRLGPGQYRRPGSPALAPSKRHSSPPSNSPAGPSRCSENPLAGVPNRPPHQTPKSAARPLPRAALGHPGRDHRCPEWGPAPANDPCQEPPKNVGGSPSKSVGRAERSSPGWIAVWGQLWLFDDCGWLPVDDDVAPVAG
jgi:hypothetical protein